MIESKTQNQKEVGDGVGGLQALREAMAAIVSLVIVVLAALTMWFTFQSAGHVQGTDTASAEAAEKAYGRQKDIMLYALALFGTVTGYYLGRVPAEANAKRAERAADSAQKTLSTTQERLSDVASNATVASAQLDQTRRDKTRVNAKLQDSIRVLRTTRDTLVAEEERENARGAGTGVRATLGAAGTPPADDNRLQDARRSIDLVLDRLQADAMD